MESSPMDCRRTVAQAMKKLPGPKGERYTEMFRHGSLQVEYYAPRGTDPQQPHKRDEGYIVISGTGTFIIDKQQTPFGPGDFLFVPAGVKHRFENFTGDLGVWVIFYGPEGGEKA